MEMLGTIMANQKGLNVNFALCFTFMGPGIPLDGQFAFGNFIRDAIYNSTIRLNTDGSALRSYLHCADLAVWLVTILVKGKKNQIYNVGSACETSIKELAELIVKYVAPDLKVIFNLGADTSPTGSSRYIPCVQKISQLGCVPTFTLREGIEQTFAYAKATHK